MTQVGRIIAVALAFVMAAAIDARGQDWKTIETEALETLRRYVRINTAVPPGDVSKAADLLQSILEREGIPVTRYESGPGRSIIVARLKGTGAAKPVMLLHHMDVVPADASRWNRDPFAADIVDGKLYGRGAFDMKGPGVAHLYAFIALKRKNVPLQRDVILMAVPDEEVGGGLGAAWMRQNHLKDIESEYILDEGGFGSRDLFTTDKLVFGISVAEKKILWLKLIAEGVAGHGSQPHDRNPNDRLTKALARLLSEPVTPTTFEVLETFRSRVGPLAANKFNNAIQNSTISLTSLRSGVGEPPKVNVIPSIAEATIDCRVLPGTSKEAWLKEVSRRLGDPEIKIEVVYEGPDPVVTTQDSDFYRALESAVRARYPEAIVTPMVVPYGTDSNGFRPLGVQSYGFTPVIVPAESVASMHGDAEFIPVDALGPAIQILFEALLQIASDAPRLPLKAALEAKFAELHKAGAFPGGTAGFALADGTSFGIAVGVSDRDAKTPMQPTDRLLMGSIGKTYVSALTLQLVKAGKIGLDDSIAKYLGKEAWFSRLPNASTITVRRLMNHTSGLVRYELNPKFTADLTASPDKVWTPEERLAYLFDAVPPFAPGEGWEYSDTNYIVLGMIVERAGGAPYYQQLRTRILEPLHLDRTIPVEGRRVPGLVQGYAGPNNPFGGTDAMIKDGRFAINPQFEWTGGGLAASAEDLAKWAKLLYGGSVIDPSLMDDLLDGVTAKLGPETKYGLGVIVRPTARGLTYGHSGFMPGYQADMMYFPELKTAIAVQVNSSAPKSTGRALRAFLTEFAAIVADSRSR